MSDWKSRAKKIDATEVKPVPEKSDWKSRATPASEATPTEGGSARSDEFDPTSMPRAAANAAFEGLTLGGGNKMLGAIYAAYDVATDPMLKGTTDFAERYKQYSKMTQDEFDATAKKHPIVSGAAELAGGIATGGAALKGLTGAARIVGGAGLGAAAGAGYSDAEATGELARDVAVGAGLGAAAERYAAPVLKGAGKLFGAGAEKLGQSKLFGGVVDSVRSGVDRLGSVLQRKTTGLGKSSTRGPAMKSAQKFGHEGEQYVDQIADDAFTGSGLVDEQPLVGKVERTGTLRDKTATKIEELNTKLNELEKQVPEALPITPEDVTQRLDNIKQGLVTDGVVLEGDKAAMRLMEGQIIPDVKTLLGEQPTIGSIRRAKDYVSTIIKKASTPDSPHEMSDKLRTLNGLYNGLDEMGEQALKQIDPALADQWKRLNRTQHVALTINSALTKTVQDAENSMIPGLPLKKLLGYGAATKFAGPLGTVSSILVDTYGASVGARLLKSLASQLESGQFIGRGAGRLNDILKSDGAEAAAKAWVRLQQQYGPEPENGK